MDKRLTPKQKKFADEYIISGHATESARRAGYKQPHVQGSQNLEKPSIQEYIKERTESLENEKVADMMEVRQLWTSIMRNEVEKTTDRLKASEMMARTKGAFIDKQETTINGRIDIGETSDIISKYLEGDDDE